MKQYKTPTDVENFLLSAGWDENISYDAAMSAGVYDALNSYMNNEHVENTAMRIAAKINAATIKRRTNNV